MQVSSVQPVFKLDLNHKVTPGIVTIAKYDGTHYCLTAAAGYDKIIIHHPHGVMGTGRAQRSLANSEVSELNLSQAVIALAAGPLKPDCSRDMLMIGSPTQILAYDVHNNEDIFYKESQDGVNVIIVGHFGEYTDKLVMVGGDSSVLGINWKGEEIFWNVVSGKVCSMIIFDFDKDGKNELLIGCEDSYIKVLKNNQFITEITETGPVICLSQINDVRFAYGLSNGTIGVYEDGVRLWRVKSKQNTISLQWSGDNLVCCWENGRIDWRDDNGRVIRRVQLRYNAASMLLADYRTVGTPDLVCVSSKGEVLGYPPIQENGLNSTVKKPQSGDRLAVTELLNIKQALMAELQHYEGNASNSSLDNDRPSAMPTNTRLQFAVAPDVEDGCLQLAISSNNDTIVRTALILAEGIFNCVETLARHPHTTQLRSMLYIPLRPPRDVPVDVHIKALIGYPKSEQFHIFELTKQIPRFSMYTLTRSIAKSKINSFVTFRITERVQRICLWINQNFILDEEIEIEDTKEFHISFICLRDLSRLDINFNDSQVKITTLDIRLAGDLVQSLATYLNLTDLQSTATFSDAENKLRAEMTVLSEIGETRFRLAAETSEKAQILTALLPAAQDTALDDLNEMLHRYKDVILINEELMAACHVRRAIQEQTVTSLTNLHTILQQAARLRVGKHSTSLVNACRKAVSDGNTEALVTILQHGDI